VQTHRFRKEKEKGGEKKKKLFVRSKRKKCAPSPFGKKAQPLRGRGETKLRNESSRKKKDHLEKRKSLARLLKRGERSNLVTYSPRKNQKFIRICGLRKKKKDRREHRVRKKEKTDAHHREKRALTCFTRKRGARISCRKKKKKGVGGLLLAT